MGARIRYWLQIFLLPIYWLSFLVPRNKRIWVVGSSFGKRWGDNGRYFYLYLSQYEKENIRPIWISRDKEIVSFLNSHGKEAYYVKSLKGIYYCLRAKVYIFDNYSKDISFWLSGGATKVNLWHGVGNKKINYDNRFDYLRHPRNLKERFSTALTRMSNEKPSHYILGTSPVYVDKFASAFRVPKEHVLMEGYPRNAVLLNDKLEVLPTGPEEENIAQIRTFKERGNRIVIYMPTFRNSEQIFFQVMDLPRFNIFLQEKAIVFFTKMHPKSKVKEVFIRAQHSNIINVAAEIDPYTFLKEADLLVTDYSSVLSDFSLLDKPAIIFPYDYREYMSSSRDFHIPFDEYIKVTRVYTMEQLMEAIARLLEEDTDGAGRQWLLNRTFACQDGDSSRRLFCKICELVELNV